MMMPKCSALTPADCTTGNSSGVRIRIAAGWLEKTSSHEQPDIDKNKRLPMRQRHRGHAVDQMLWNTACRHQPGIDAGAATMIRICAISMTALTIICHNSARPTSR